MKLSFKNVFLSVGIFTFLLGIFAFVSVNTTEAADIVSAASGAWNSQSTWVGGVVPVADDTVTISAEHTITLGAYQTVASISSLTISSGGTLTNDSSVSIPVIIVEGTLTNSGSMTVDTSLSGNGMFINYGTLKLGGISSVRTLSSTAYTSTVYYTGSMQTCKSTSYYNLVLSGSGQINCSPYSVTNVTTSGTSDWTLTSSLDIGGNLTVGSGSSITTGASPLTVNGNTYISGGILTLNNSTGAKTFIGPITVNSGILNGSSNSIVTMSGITNINGTVSITGTDTISTPYAVFKGNNSISNLIISTGTSVSNSNALPFSGNLTIDGSMTNSNAMVVNGNLIINGSITNSGTLDIKGNLTVNGSMTNTSNGTFAAAAVLASSGTITNNGIALISSFNGTLAELVNTGGLYFTGADEKAVNITKLIATGTDNTVNYNRNGSQKIKDTTYFNLMLSGSGVKSIANEFNGCEHERIVNETHFCIQHLSFTTGVSMSLENDLDFHVYDMKYNDIYLRIGIWGGLDSAGPAEYENDTYFTRNTRGTIHVSSDTYGIINNYFPIGKIVDIPPITTVSPPVVPVTEVVDPVAVVDAGCVGGNSYSTLTGKACVASTVVVPGCSGGNLFSTSTGAACTNNTSVTSGKRVYVLGTTTLRNGSTGFAVKELQRFLNDKLSLGLVIDGILGPNTIAVMKTWQRANGLVPDGLIGPKTKAMINK